MADATPRVKCAVAWAFSRRLPQISPQNQFKVLVLWVFTSIHMTNINACRIHWCPLFRGQGALLFELGPQHVGWMQTWAPGISSTIIYSKWTMTSKIYPRNPCVSGELLLQKEVLAESLPWLRLSTLLTAKTENSAELYPAEWDSSQDIISR